MECCWGYYQILIICVPLPLNTIYIYIYIIIKSITIFARKHLIEYCGQQKDQSGVLLGILPDFNNLCPSSSEYHIYIYIYIIIKSVTIFARKHLIEYSGQQKDQSGVLLGILPDFNNLCPSSSEYHIYIYIYIYI